MPTTRPPTILTLSGRVYSLLLRLCPAEYHREYGPPMAQAFRDLAREAYRRHGAWGVVALWARILPDTLATALADNWAALRAGDGAGLHVVPTILVLLSLLAPGTASPTAAARSPAGFCSWRASCRAIGRSITCCWS